MVTCTEQSHPKLFTLNVFLMAQSLTETLIQLPRDVLNNLSEDNLRNLVSGRDIDPQNLGNRRSGRQLQQNIEELRNLLHGVSIKYRKDYLIDSSRVYDQTPAERVLSMLLNNRLIQLPTISYSLVCEKLLKFCRSLMSRNLLSHQ